MADSKHFTEQEIIARKRSTNRVLQAGIDAAKRAGATEKSIQLLESMKRKI
jgi:hypothetical protein